MKIIETNFKFNSNYTLMYSTPKGVVLHHAASTSCTVSDVHSWHLARGYAGIGYHFFVDKSGNIYRGRPENWIGAHTTGYNKNIGICAEGNFEKHAMPEPQKQAIVELVKYLNSKYGDLKIYRHKDLDSTACPGRNYQFVEIVNGVSKINEVKTQAEVTARQKGVNKVTIYLDALQKGSEGEQVKALQTLLNQKLGIKLAVDGDFGSKTHAAVTDYQKSKCLEVDGVVGTLTWNKLLGG